MFYPEESLKKGGRFYLCWVADSWPLCFATITQRQLWSQDVRRICDDLMEVISNESGRPTNRFSLRLSSQLMRGLVRLYQRKVTIMLGDLCMINARVMKNSNKKFNILEPPEEIERQLFPMLELPAVVPEIVVENEERVEEMIQQSGNIVRNLEDITLKEAAIPDFQLPPNDGFGEENPNQALQLLQDRTLEQMLGASTSAAHSGLELAANVSEPDKTRESRHGIDVQMEPIAEHDVTLFRKSTVPDVLLEQFEKDIPIPEIPPLDLPAPPEKPTEEPVVEKDIPPVDVVPQEPIQQPIQVELEELEALEPQAKRRRKNRLIIDKKIMLPSSFLRPRVENIAVELRCEDSSEDIVDLRVPWVILSSRPAAAGARFHSKTGLALTRMFMRNLSSAGLGQQEMELALASRGGRSRNLTILEIIPEEQQIQEPPQIVIEPPQVVPELQMLEQELLQPEEPSVLNQSTAVPDLRVSEVGADIAELPTQRLERLSQKRSSQESNGTPKRPRLSGYVSFRQQQLRNFDPQEQEIVDKENIPDNRQTMHQPQMQPVETEEQIIPEVEIQPSSDPEKRLTSLLQAAGLADIEIRPEVVIEDEPQRKSRRLGSDSSETMLGSLDRTKVSLGDSEHTTDSKRFIREQWGTEGTMVKILKALKSEVRPLSICALVAAGPLVPGHKRVVAARCFNSILKLKQHGFIKVEKNPETLEVEDIFLGPKFDSY